MSYQPNTDFYEQVAEFIDEHEGMSHINDKVERLMTEAKFEDVITYMNAVDAELSQDHFHNYNILEASDVF